MTAAPPARGTVAVLVAIAIPIFTTQLEKSRESVDLSNIRSAYAEVMTSALTGTKKDEGNVKYADGKWTETVTLKQQTADWQTDVTEVELGGVKNGDWTGKPAKGGTCVVSYDGTTAAIEFKAG